MKLPSPPGKFLYIPVKITWKTEKKDSFSRHKTGSVFFSIDATKQRDVHAVCN